MGELLARDAAQAAVLPIQWDLFLQQFPPHAEPLLYAEAPRHASAKPAAVSPQQILPAWKDVAANQRRPVIAAYLRGLVVQTLGLDPSQPMDDRQPHSELGLDSLMAVEIRNALGIALGKILPVSLLYEYATIEALTGYMAGELPGFEIASSPAVEVAEVSRPEADLLKNASEEEAEALLIKELEELNF
jgi:acyl carrier protein